MLVLTILMFICCFIILEIIFKIQLRFLFLCLICVFFLLLVSAIFVNAKEYTPAEIVLMGKVVHHEAGNQSELGKRLVADTILNRVESPYFPNTVDGVINQPGQYCNPRKYPPDGMYKIIAEEIYRRTNSEVLYFKTNGYHAFGVPIIKEGNHYFSGR